MKKTQTIGMAKMRILGALIGLTIFLVDFDDFPLEDARLAVSHMDMDWDKQAVMYAQENCSGTSKAGLSDNMRHYGFNKEQIDMALKEVGY